MPAISTEVWFSAAVTLLAAIVTIVWTHRNARNRRQTEPDRLLARVEASDALIHEARELMGAENPYGLSRFRPVSDARYDEAKARILAAMRKTPDYAPVHYSLGVLAALRKNDVEALKNLRMAATLDNSNAVYLYGVGKACRRTAHHALGQSAVLLSGNGLRRVKPMLAFFRYYFQAIRHLRKALRIDPGFAEAHRSLAQTLLPVFPRRARRHFETAATLKPNNSAILLSLARSYWLTGDLVSAKGIATKALRCAPHEQAALEMLQSMHAQEGNGAKVLEYGLALTTLMDSDKDRPDRGKGAARGNSDQRADVASIAQHPVVTHLRRVDDKVALAVSHLVQQRYEDAEIEFRRLSANNPREPMYPLALAKCALQSGDLPAAQSWLEASGLNERNRYWQSVQFELLCRQHDHATAAARARQWWQTDDENFSALIMYCQSAICLGMHKTAADALDEADHSALVEHIDGQLLADIYLSLNQPEIAASLLNAALAKNPKNASVYLQYCRVCLATEDYERVPDYAKLARAHGADLDACNYYRALGLHRQRNLVAAIELLKECIALRADKAEYHIALGRAYVETGQSLLAETAFDTAQLCAPAWGRPLTLLGELQLRRGNFEEAAANLERAIALSPDDDEPLFLMARCCAQQNAPEAAIEYYRRTLDLNDSDSVSHHNLGCVYADQGNTELARACFEKAVALSPSYAPAQFNIGCLLIEDGHRQEAAEQFEKAYAASPENAFYAQRLATVYANSRQYGPAIDIARGIVEKDPENYNGWRILGKCHAALGNRDAALDAFHSAAEHSELRRPEFLNEAGNVHLALNEFEAALACYTKVTRLFPNDPAAVMNIGIVKRQLGAPDSEVLRWYDRATKFSPGYPLPYFNRANVYYARQEMAAAKAELEKAIELDESYVAALNMLGTILMDDPSDIAAARRMLQRCIELDPGYAFAHRNLGRLHFETGDAHGALPHLRRAIEIDAGFADAYKDLVSCCRDLGLDAEAQTASEKLAALESQ